MLDRILGGLKKDADAPEPTEAELKAERIKFHRQHVRTGPSRFKSVTTGQIRRAEERARRSHERKTNIRHRRHFKNRQLGNAVIRAKLQAVGVFPYVTGYRATENEQYRAGVWLIQNFAPRNEQSEIVFDDHTLERAIDNATATLRGESLAKR